VLLRAFPRVSAKATISLYRATIHWTIAPPTSLQIGLKAKALIKNAQALEMGVSLAWLSKALLKNQGACFFCIWWLRLEKEVC
jgi:hypothetical protein